MTHRLPRAWLETTIDELFRTTGGGTPATGCSEFWGDGVPWITSADIDEAGNISPRKTVTPSGIASSPTSRVPPGSVIVVTRVGLGKVGLAKHELCFSQDCQALLFDPELMNPSFVAHQTRGTVRGIRGRGTTIAGVTVKQLGALPFSLAPLREQQRIVGAINSYLTRLDDAVASLKQVQAKLKAYRASVLKAAVEGRLVPTEESLARTEKRDYEAAEVLLARILKERRRRWEEAELARLKASGKTPKDDKWKGKYQEPSAPDVSALPGLPQGWCWATVEGLSTKVVDGVHKKPNYVSSGVPFVTVKNLTAGLGIDLENLKYITTEDHQAFIARANPERGDLLVSKDGTLGVIRAVRTDRVFSIFVSVAMVKPVLISMSDYLELAFSSPTVQIQMVPKGSGLQHIHLEDLRKDCVPVPPEPEQRRIFEAAQKQMSVVDWVEEAVTFNLARLSRLRQVILKWAFEGKLVDQDPTDEPAEELLARIRTERAAVTPTKRRRDRTSKRAT